LANLIITGHSGTISEEIYLIKELSDLFSNYSIKDIPPHEWVKHASTLLEAKGKFLDIERFRLYVISYLNGNDVNFNIRTRNDNDILINAYVDDSTKNWKEIVFDLTNGINK
jgi:hypothetical protein